LESNEQAEDTFVLNEQSTMYSELCPNLDKFAFVNIAETEAADSSQRPVFVGREALALHKSESYLMRYPIKYGDLNASEAYPPLTCVED
jgi:hypothetical protein